jgi:hypothetical protein
MSLSDWFQSLWKKQAEHYVYATIPPERQQPRVEPVRLQAEKHYLRLWLSESFLADDRRLFREYVPVVHSSVRLQFANNPAQELPFVAGASSLGMGTTLGKGVQLNHALTNLLPFRGGTVAIATALFAYKQKDFFQGFLDVLNEVSGLLNVGQLSATLQVASGAVDGIQSLLGAGEKDGHLLYFQQFGGAAAEGGSPLVSGYQAIIRARAGQFDVAKLWVRDGRLLIGDSADGAKPLEGYDYMLLRVEAADRRDDFLGFPEFSHLLAKAIEKGISNEDEGRKVLETAQIAVWASPDLTQADRARVAIALRDEFRAAVSGTKAVAPGAAPAFGLAALERSVSKRAAGLSLPRVTTERSPLDLQGEGSSLDEFLKAVR